jgi:hypothetical protein
MIVAEVIGMVKQSLGEVVRSAAEAYDCFGFLLAGKCFYFLAGWSAEEGTACESLPLPQFV